MTGPIDPRRLKELRQRKKMSQQELARRAKLTKGSVHRMEAGKQPGSRKRTLEGLAAALGVAAGMLTGEVPLPPPADAGHSEPELPESQMNFRVDDAVRNAYWLASKGYNVPMARIVELAPYLFVCAAEASLARRRARLAELDELYGRQRDLADAFPHLPEAISANMYIDEALKSENESIAASDILATDLTNADFQSFEPIGARSSPDRTYEAAAQNPFVLSLRQSEPSDKGVASISRFDDSEADFIVRKDIAVSLCGGDAELGDRIVAGEAPLYRMPGDLLPDAAAPARAAWLRERCAEYRAQARVRADAWKSFLRNHGIQA